MLLGAQGVGECQKTEYYEALDRRVCDPTFPIVSVVIATTAPGLPFLRHCGCSVSLPCCAPGTRHYAPAQTLPKGERLLVAVVARNRTVANPPISVTRRACLNVRFGGLCHPSRPGLAGRAFTRPANPGAKGDRTRQAPRAVAAADGTTCAAAATTRCRILPSICGASPVTPLIHAAASASPQTTSDRSPHTSPGPEQAHNPGCPRGSCCSMPVREPCGPAPCHHRPRAAAAGQGSAW